MLRTRINVVAPAKVNLWLEVLSRRDDGFHEVRTVLQAIDVLDRLEFSPDSEARAFTMEMEPEVPGVPLGEGNLCHSAYLGYCEAAPGAVPAGLHLRLRKRIPVAAGLGGGSSDAAATLLALNELSGGRLSAEELADVAAGLGSDVPFFLEGGTAWAEGRGEQVKSLSAAAPLWVAVAKPQGALSAREVYAAWDRRQAEEQRPPISESEWVRALASGSAAALEPLMYNGLQAAVIEMVPAAGRLIQAASEAGMRAMVSGSGPTVFALSDSAAGAREIASVFEPLAQEIFSAPFRSKGCEEAE